MREKLVNGIWNLGVRARDAMKQVGLLGPLEEILAHLGPRLVPPPSTEVEVLLPQSMKIIIPPNFWAARNFITGVYERKLTDLFEAIVEEGMTVVDLGASIGYYTLLASRLVGRSGHVYAFEPDPQSYYYLRRNVDRNNCLSVSLVNKAASNKEGPARFNKGEMGRGKVLQHAPDDHGITIEAITLDDYFAQEGWPPVDLVKMDIEGSEKSALEGMKELVGKNPNVKLIIESSLRAMHDAGVTSEALSSVLRKLGFERGFIVERGLQPFLVAETFPVSHAMYNLLLIRT